MKEPEAEQAEAEQAEVQETGRTPRHRTAKTKGTCLFIYLVIYVFTFF